MSRQSLKKIGVKFSDTKQGRSELAIQNLVEAAEQLIASGEAARLTARDLSSASGYSLGTLVKRLGKVENVFLHAIAYGREKHIHAICTQAESRCGNITVAEFAEFLVDTGLHAMQNIVGPSIIRYYESRALGRVNSLADVHAYTDDAVPTVMKIIAKDQTGTFRQMSPFEAKNFLARFFTYSSAHLSNPTPKQGQKYIVRWLYAT